MEILFISHKYPPTIGGMEKQCYELVTGCNQSHTVHKVLLNKTEENVVQFFWKLKKRVKTVLKNHPNIDIIHLNDGLMAYFGLWLKKYTKIPVVVTFHGLDIVFPNKVFQQKIVPQFKQFDGYICVSEATRLACLSRGFDTSTTYTVANGVDHELAILDIDSNPLYESFQQQYKIDLRQRKVIVSLGRPVPRKGFSWFLKNIVPQLDDDYLFLMIGPRSKSKKTALWKRLLPQKWVHEINLFLGAISDEREITALIAEKQLEGKVIQTGAIPFKDVMGLLGMSDLFVMPNVKVEGDAEGFGLVALEASLRKTPVLASKLEGITEAIQDQKNGFLLPPSDATAWLKKIEELFQQPEELVQIGTTFQQFTLNNYSWEKMTKGYIAVFEKIIAKEKP